MKLRMQLLVLTGLVLVQATILVPGYAAEAHMFRCVDSDGRAYYSDIQGVGCEGEGDGEGGKHDSLTRHGIVLDRPEGATGAHPEESAEQRSLQAPMLSVKWGMKKLDIYRTQLVELTIREAELIKINKPVSDALRDDIDAADADVVRIERDLAAKRADVDKIVARYESDKERFRKAGLPPRRR